MLSLRFVGIACAAVCATVTIAWATPGYDEGTSAAATGFQSWVERRDAGLVRQSYDFSCGLAALATLMSWQGVPVTERALLGELAEGDDAEPGGASRISFAVLADLARAYGFQSQGVSLPADILVGLRRPAIVALEVEGRAHFSVIRAVADDGAVLLADPSWGHRRLSAWEFRRAFERPVSGHGGDTVVSLTDAPAGEMARGQGRLLLLARSDPAAEKTGAGRADGEVFTTTTHSEPWRWPVRMLPLRP